MKRFVSFLCLFSQLICASISLDFCDVKTMDNVFNVGHFIYLTRCGEVWSFDPRARNGRGDFFIDYSWFGFARINFASKIAKQKRRDFDDKDLHFAAFSFHGLECEDPWFRIERDCEYSAQQWNGLSVMADNYSAITFRFQSEIIFTNDTNNPLGFPPTQDLLPRARMAFWPNLAQLAPEYHWNTRGIIHSALFIKEVTYRLYIALISSDNYLCITHLNMQGILFDVQRWPKNWAQMGGNKDHQWAPPLCFKGNVVGMFEKDGQAYVAGRILSDSRQYEDQVYKMLAIDGLKVTIDVVNIPGYDHPHNLRTFFGCNVPDSYIELPSDQVNVQNLSLTLPKPQRRRQRSVEEIKQIIGLIWTDIRRELRNDWLLWSAMSATALFMLFIIFRLKNN